MAEEVVRISGSAMVTVVLRMARWQGKRIDAPERSIISVKAEQPQFEFLSLHEELSADKSVAKNVE